jgi:GNAT superfamily N-acetyltransferase
MTEPASEAPALPVQFRPWRDEDAPAVVGLLQRCFPRWPREVLPVAPIDHLRWKLASHPLAPALAVIGELDGRIITYGQAQISAALIDDRPGIVGNGGDLALDPDYRGKGIYLRFGQWRIEQHLKAGVDLFLQDYADERVRRTTARNGYIELGNPVEIFDRRLHAPAGWLGAPAQLIASLKGRRAGPLVTSTRAFDARFDELYAEAAGQFRFIRDRRAARLAWRFGDRRGGPSEILVVESDARIDGYAALRHFGSRGFLADMLVAPGCHDVASALARAAVEKASSLGLKTLRCWLPANHVYRPALEAAGLRARGRRAGHHYRPLGAPMERLAFLRDPRAPVHVMMGDADFV